MAENVEISSPGNGRFHLREGDRTSVAYAVAPPGAIWVHLNGRVYVIDAAGSRAARSTQHEERLALSVPMPATVTQVNVGEGEQVTTGHVIMMLEAMKMELPITAPRQGRVKAILCRPGERVEPGVPLVELE